MIPMRQQGAMVVDWTREERPACGLVPASVQWSAGYGFRRAIVTTWGPGPAELVFIDAAGERSTSTLPATPAEARAAAESWLLDTTEAA